jgi:hypothetical protein
VVDPTDVDYSRLWQIVNENNRDRYTAYQQQTARPIPVIALIVRRTPGDAVPVTT